jgi:enoyl-CoA hydratase/carnithine racemase
MEPSSPVALVAAKRALRRGWGLPLDAALAIEDEEFSQVLTRSDRLEGLRAFAEKRLPNWPSAHPDAD